MRTANRALLILVFFLISISFPIISQDMEEMKKNIDDWNSQLSEAMMKGDNKKKYYLFMQMILFQCQVITQCWKVKRF